MSVCSVQISVVQITKEGSRYRCLHNFPTALMMSYGGTPKWRTAVFAGYFMLSSVNLWKMFRLIAEVWETHRLNISQSPITLQFVNFIHWITRITNDKLEKCRLNFSRYASRINFEPEAYSQLFFSLEHIPSTSHRIVFFIKNWKKIASIGPTKLTFLSKCRCVLLISSRSFVRFSEIFLIDSCSDFLSWK